MEGQPGKVVRQFSLRSIILIAFLLSLVTVGAAGTGHLEALRGPQAKPRAQGPDGAAGGASDGRNGESGGSRTNPENDSHEPGPVPQPEPDIPLSPVLRLDTPRESTDIALTFDDGPHPVWTPQVLDLLKRYDIRATFCMIGEQVVEYSEIVERVVSEGHALCNHTWDHDMNLDSQSDEAVDAELGSTSAALLDAGGTPARYYRAPGGFWSDPVVSTARDQGMVSLGWNIDPQDWTLPGASSITDALRDVAPGDIVLLHDGGGDRSQTVEALREALPDLLWRGFTFVTP